MVCNCCLTSLHLGMKRKGFISVVCGRDKVQKELEEMEI